MKFSDLDARMRVFETSHDHSVIPGVFMVARLDGRNFTKLTKRVCDPSTPFDKKFSDFMTQTTSHLMSCGFPVIYAFTESDEISLLFRPTIDTFNRKLRKFNSVLASEAGAKFSLLMQHPCTFDCRISQLPTLQNVIDYFRWRSEDAHRNALSTYCYHILHSNGYSGINAEKRLHGLTASDKNNLLFSHGINFNNIPDWQKQGVGLYWESFNKDGFNPKLNESVIVRRRRIKINHNLLLGDEYIAFIKEIVITSYKNG